MTALLRLLGLLLQLMVWAAAGAAALAGGPDTAPAAMNVFIDEQGLGRATVRRSNLDALWGPAEVEKPVTPSRTSRDWAQGPWLRLDYPSRGLSFSTPRGVYGQSDPPIEHAYFTHPFHGCTPQGLCMGMTQEAALAIISSRYRITGDYATSYGHSGRITGRSYSARNRGWRTTHTMSFGFNEGKLYSMSFQLMPTPLISLVELKRGLGALLGLAVLVFVGLVIEAVKKRLEPVAESPLWEVGRLGLGSGLLIVGIGGMVLGFGALSGGGDGYARLVMLILGLGAAGVAVLALMVFSRSSNRFISRGASGVLLVGLIALLVAQIV